MVPLKPARANSARRTDRESPQQRVPATPWVDIPKVPIGSPTYSLDVLAALSGDRRRLLISVVNPTEAAQDFVHRITGVRLHGPGKLSLIAAPERRALGSDVRPDVPLLPVLRAGLPQSTPLAGDPHAEFVLRFWRRLVWCR